MATITTINGTDTITSSRSVINTNFSNLNTDKEEVSNKATTMTGNNTSNIVFLTAKAIYGWGIATFMALVAPGASGNVLTSNGTSWVSSAPAGGGGGSQCEPLQDYMGPAIIGVLGVYVFDSSKTGSKYTITVDSIPVGSNLIVELRKNSYTSGNVLSSTLKIATTDTLTNGKKTVSITDTDSYVAGDYVVAYLTSVGSTTPALNPYFTLTIS